MKCSTSVGNIPHHLANHDSGASPQHITNDADGTDKIKNAANEAVDGVKDVAQAAKDKVSDIIGGGKDAAKDTGNKAQQKMNEVVCL
jgi:polyhydroxyalkanoate synthesis regulator phasin